MRKFIFLIVLISILLPLGLNAKKKDKAGEQDTTNPLNSKTFMGLKPRLIGTALISGRITDLAVDPGNHDYIVVASASGGVWKTMNHGTSWTPLFDTQGSFSIGCVALDPANPWIIWVGTGENNSQRSVSYGDGVYRSVDGGKTWTNTGLKKSEHIGKIIIDPKNSNIVYVAAQGPLWNPGGDRGLFKTTDAGKTWTIVLSISENTGVSDIAMDPRDNNVLYASSYQRRRHVWTLIDGGPEGAIYKSVDAGATWNKLTNGLPSGDIGRIGLAISPVNPDIVYALVEAADGNGGFYRSIDRGAQWEKRNGYNPTSPQYYQEIFCDPKNPDRVYSIDTYTKVTEDGGKTFTNVGLKQRHVDDHVIWIDPSNTNHLFIGGDGGIYETYDRGENWRFFENLPVSQYYRVTTDNTLPFYYVYGGTQDNNSLGGPSRTKNAAGILNQDWFFTVGGDGFKTVIDPVDPNIVYSQSQYGNLNRYDRKSGEQTYVQPQEEKGEELRWNWDSPVIISPFSHTRLYFAANKLFRSDDRGDSWKAISGDLTRQIDRNKLEIMGKVWSPDAVSKNASTSFYGNIVSLCESPKKENLVYAGTDDGLINITENAGGSWSKVETFPGVPETTYVSCLYASQHDEKVVYAAFDNHKKGDFKPYLLKSNNKGKSWTSITANLPENGVVYTIAEDHVNPRLLFAGTEFGLFFTIDGGEKWVQMKGDFPTIAVRDLDIQKRENDLAIGTFGRGIYILDDYTPLRVVNPEILDSSAYLFPVKDALMYLEDYSNGRDSFGETFFRAKNPDFGATFTYYLKEPFKTLKEIRQEKEKELREKGETPPYPTIDQLRAEDKEEAPVLIFEIRDDAANLVRRLTAKPSTGINRIAWDLRMPDLSPVTEQTDINKASGLPVMPGKYNVTMLVNRNGSLIKLAGPIEFKTKVLQEVTLPAPDPAAVAAFYKKTMKMEQAIYGASKFLEELVRKVKLIRSSELVTPGIPDDVVSKTREIELSLDSLSRSLNGDPTLARLNENQTPSIMERMNRLLYSQWTTSSETTQGMKDNYTIAGDAFASFLAKLRSLYETDILNLEKRLNSTDAPWTPGRIPVWNKE